MPIIHVENLTRDFQGLRAVDSVNFDVQEGELFGFLGPNGAGKSTTIKMLCTLLAPTTGTAIVNGFDISKQQNDVRRSLGIIFQDPSLDDRLTAWENLEFHAMLYKIPHERRKPRMELLLNMVDLSDRKDDIVKTFSGGMKRRLEIARGLLHFPKILFLDEPTLGLDPQTRVHIWDYLNQLRKTEGTTLFLTTHYMEEAEYCDRIAIIDHGKIIALDTPKSLKSQVGGDIINIRTKDNQKATEEIKTKFNLQALTIDGKLQLQVPDATQFAPQLLTGIETPIEFINFQPPTLEDVFLKFTGREIRDESASTTDKMRLTMKRSKRWR
jgi:ABC-2 type transport system ATP-binding protein